MIEERITRSSYRRVIDRKIYKTDFVIRDGTAVHADWVGQLQSYEGPELQREKTRLSINEAIVFGPSGKTFKEATTRKIDGGDSYEIEATPEGGLPVVWTIDSHTWLPTGVRTPGVFFEDKIDFDDWRTVGDWKLPFRVTQHEGRDEPATWRRQNVRFAWSLPAKSFHLDAAPDGARIGSDAVTVPITREGNLVIVKASVNGSEPMNFALNFTPSSKLNSLRTGALGLEVFGESIDNNTSPPEKYSRARHVSFKIAGVEIRDQIVVVEDQGRYEHALGIPMGGSLGDDLFSRFVVEIDFEKNILTLHARDWNYSGTGAVVPIVLDRDAPYANATISLPSGKTVLARLNLELGVVDPLLLNSPFVESNDLIEEFSLGDARGRTLRAVLPRLTLGSLVLEPVPANLSTADTGDSSSPTYAGTLGRAMMKRYRLIVDYPHHRMIFEETARSRTPFLRTTTYGLGVTANGDDFHQFAVAAVRKGSPAEEDGFRKSDVIQSIDDKPASDFSLKDIYDWLQTEGTRHVVEIVRNGVSIRLEVVSRLN